MASTSHVGTSDAEGQRPSSKAIIGFGATALGIAGLLFWISHAAGPKGLFMADREGNFSFQIMSNHGRHLFANSPPAVVMARYDGLLEAMTYFGTYAVGEEKLTLRVAHCQFRGCDRADRKAELSIKGDTLTMTSAVKPSPTGAFYSYTVWKRECCR